MPLRRHRPTFPLWHPHSAPRFCGGSLCCPAWPNLPGSQIGGAPVRTSKTGSAPALPSLSAIGRALLPAVAGLPITGRWQWRPEGTGESAEEGPTQFFPPLPPQECQGLVDREPFHLRCLAAVCGCAPGKDCLCPVLAAFARRCAQEGALSLWRTQTLCRESAQSARPCPLPPAPRPRPF